MARPNGGDAGTFQPDHSKIITADGGQESILIGDSDFLKNADFVKDGGDLIIRGDNGEQIIVEGYFEQFDPPALEGAGGHVFPPELVKSFLTSGYPGQYAGPMQGAQPVGAAAEVSGNVSVTRADGTVEMIQPGMPIFQGDIIQTDSDGAVNIVFMDETSFAVSEDAKLAIDEYVFDPQTGSGSSDFSVIKGVFVFTSGLIGREDPDDVNIDTPIGSIGIRGTVIAGNVTTGEITVVEGAIVLRDFAGNEMTLALQFETAQFDPVGGTIINLGPISPADIAQKFTSVSRVSPGLFASINDAAAEQGEGQGQGNGAQTDSETGEGREPQNQDEGAGGDAESGTSEAGTTADQTGNNAQTQDDGATEKEENAPAPPQTGSGDRSGFEDSSGLGGSRTGDGRNDEGQSAGPALPPPPPPPPPGDPVGAAPPPPSDNPLPPPPNGGPSTLNPSTPVGTDANVTSFLMPSEPGLFSTGSMAVIDISSTFSDPQSDPLDFAKVSGPAWINVSPTGEVSFTAPNLGADQSFNVLVHAYDPSGNLGTATITVDILAPDVLGDGAANTLNTNSLGQVVVGLGGNDTITGGDSDSILFAGDGNDTITASGANGTVFAGTGDDNILASGENALVYGEDGQDTISVTGLNGTVYAGAGADTFNIDGNGALLEGGAGADIFNINASGDWALAYGGTGADVFNVSGNNGNFIGQDDNDVFNVLTGSSDNNYYGGGGIDDIDYSGFGAAIDVTLNGANAAIVTGPNDTLHGIENIFGSAFADTIMGDANNNMIHGGGGNDFLGGGGGNDALDGGAGTDTLDITNATGAVTVNLTAGTSSGGGLGNDTLAGIESVMGSAFNDTITGDANANTLAGGAGNDTLDGGAGVDILDGGDGDDTFIASDGNDTYAGGAGDDTYDAAGIIDEMTVDLSMNQVNFLGGTTHTVTGIENFVLGNFNDTVFATDGDGDQDYVGGGGIDIYNASGAAGDVTINLTAGTASGGGIGNDTIANFGVVFGSAFNDTLSGNAAANTLDGGDGDDTILSGSGNDTVNGGTGNDTIDGGAGDDTLNGNDGEDDFILSSGSDTIDGGTGTDLYIGSLSALDLTLNVSAANVTVNKGATGTDTLTNVEAFALGTGNNIINASDADGDQIFDGTAGSNDTYDASNVSNNLTINVSSDSVSAAGSNDTVEGIETFILGAGVNTVVANIADGSQVYDGTMAGGTDTYDASSISSGVFNVDSQEFFSGGDMDTLLDFDEVIMNGGEIDVSGSMSASNTLNFTGLNEMEVDTGVNTVTVSGADDIRLEEYLGASFKNVIDATSAGGIDINLVTNTINNDGFGTSYNLLDTGTPGLLIDGIIGSSDDDRVIVRADELESNASTIYSFDSGNDELDIYVTDPAGFTVAFDTVSTRLDGGLGGGVNDVLRFTTFSNGRTISLDTGPGPQDHIRGFETFDFVSNSQNDYIDITLYDDMFDSNFNTALTININDGDNLDLDFSNLSDFNITGGDINFSGGDTFVTLSDGSRTITVNYGSTGGTGSIDLIGLPLVLNLNDIVSNINNTDGDFFGGAAGPPQRFGDTFSFAGDLNNDGFDDFVAIEGADNTSSQGEYFTFRGAALGPAPQPATAGTFFNGSLLGSNISLIGDFNGDGLEDFIIGAPDANTVAAGSGQAVIVDGASGNVIMDLDDLGTNDLVGEAVTGVGDVNGDGYDDVLIGAPGADPGGNSNAGEAYLLFGDGAPPSAFGVASIDGSNGVRFDGNAVNDLLGTNVAGIGDINGDGYGDVAVAEAGSGTVHILPGSATVGGGGVVAMGTDTITITGVNVGIDNEIPLFNPGDMDGDGLSDLVIGSTDAEGAAYFFSGSSLPAASGSTPVGGAHLTINGTASHHLVGGGSVGDFNGDGLDDFAVVFQDQGAMENIDIFVVYGDAGLTGNLDFSALNGNPDTAFHIEFTVPGSQNPADFDIEINKIGDVNGDGYYDLGIGVPDYDIGEDGDDSDGGLAVVYGRDTGIPGSNVVQGANPSASATGQSLVGDETANNMDGTGFANTSFSAGAGNDTIQLSASQVPDKIDGGAGHDTIFIAGTSSTLDFTSLNTEKVTRIEEIEFGQTGQTLTLALADIFGLLSTSDTGEIFITGNAQLNLKTGAAATDLTEAQFQTEIGANAHTNDVAKNGGTYDVFEIGGKTVNIDSVLFTNNNVDSVV